MVEKCVSARIAGLPELFNLTSYERKPGDNMDMQTLYDQGRTRHFYNDERIPHGHDGSSVGHPGGNYRHIGYAGDGSPIIAEPSYGSPTGWASHSYTAGNWRAITAPLRDLVPLKRINQRNKTLFDRQYHYPIKLATFRGLIGTSYRAFSKESEESLNVLLQYAISNLKMDRAQAVLAVRKWVTKFVKKTGEADFSRASLKQCSVSGRLAFDCHMRTTHENKLICGYTYRTQFFSCSVTGIVYPQGMRRNVRGINGYVSMLTCQARDYRNIIHQCPRCENYMLHRGASPRFGCCGSAQMDTAQEQSYGANALELPNPFRQTANDEKNPIWLGVELEVAPRSNTKNACLRMCDTALNKVTGLEPFALSKHDGSISGVNGFEIVTIPASLNYHRDAWARFFDGTAPNDAEKRKQSASRALRSWDTGCCGMHVHIGIDTFTPLELGRFMLFYNQEINGAFISSVAGRVIDKYASYCPTDLSIRNVSYGANVMDCSNGKPRLDDSGKRRGWNRNSHYAAVGISSRNQGKTAEVRIFRGNVAKAGFFKNLEFVHASVLFVKQAGNKNLSPVDFLRWFDDPKIRGGYTYLWKWLTDQGWLDTRHKLQKDAESPSEVA